MLEGLVAWVLNNYLGKYVENLNTDQLSVALLSGKVELENLPLKKDALRHLGLPVEVRAGFIGRVQLQVPVRQLRSAPWVIAIDKLYLVAAPVNLDEWDAVAEANYAHERKVALLDAMEAQWRAAQEALAADAGYYAASYSSWLSYGTGLLANVAENLQLILNDVHIRYEDGATCARAFACGLTAAALRAESCDATGRRGRTPLPPDNDGCSFKLLELQQLAVYWDPMSAPQGMMADCSISELTERMSQTWLAPHQYLLAPATATARVRRERTEQPLRSRTRPRLACHLTLDTVSLSLTQHQYSEAVGCSLGLERIGKLRQFRALRPAVPVAGAARQWWLYALKCHCPDHTWMEPAPTWESCLEAARAARQYVDTCLVTLAQPAATLPPERKATKDEYEWRTPLHLLRPLREIAMRKVPKATPASTPEQPSNSGRSMLVQWFPQWWGWYGGGPEPAPAAGAPPAPAAPLAPPAPAAPAPPGSPLPTQPDLEEEILDVLADSLENNTMLKRDTVFGQFEFVLNKGCLNLCMDSEDMDGSKDTSTDSLEAPVGLELQFSDVRVGLESRIRASSHSLHVSLGSVCLRERIVQGSLFPVLVAPAPLGLARGGLGVGPRPPPPAAAEPLFQLLYEKKPFGVNADYKLWVKSAPLEVVYCAAAARWAQQFLAEPWGAAAAAAAPLTAYDQTKARLMTQWTHMLHPRQGDRRSWHVELDISAPQIIFVEALCERDAAVLVLDFGRLRLANAHAQPPPDPVDDEEMFMTPCSTPPGSLLSPASPPPGPAPQPALDATCLHNRLYDRYTIEFSDLQILVGRARDNWKYAHTKSTSSLHLLDRFSISLQAERRVVHTTDPQYPTATLCGTLPALVVHLSEQKVLAVRAVLARAPLLHTFRERGAGGAAAAAAEDASESSEPESGPAPHHATLFMLQFAIDQMSLEVQSRGRSIAEVQVCGVRAAATARPAELALALSVHSLLLVDALQTYGPDFELLVASHKHVGMDTASGSIRGSEPTSPTSPASPDARAPPPHALQAALYSLHSSSYPEPDRLSPGPSWPSGTNCSQLAGGAWGAAGGVDEEALIAVELTLVKGEEEDLRIANILFNNLDIIANQETIVELIGFTQRVLGGGPRAPAPAPTSSPPPAHEQHIQKEVRTEITFDFHRLGVLLLRAAAHDGGVVANKVATATVSEARIQATLDASRVEVDGSLGGVQVVSLWPGAGLHTRALCAGRAPAAPQPAPPDQRALLFTATRRPSPSGVEASVSIHVASVWVTHSSALLRELSSCLAEFKQYLANLARSIRAAAADMAIGLVQPRGDSLYANPKLSSSMEGVSPRRRTASLGCSVDDPPEDISLTVNIELESPVVVVPRSAHSPQVFVAHLGRMSLANRPAAPAAPPARAAAYRVRVTDISLAVNIELESPVVVVPRSAHSPQVFVAHLGRMSLANRPAAPAAPPARAAAYRVRVTDISLASVDVSAKLKQHRLCADSMPAIYDTGGGKPVLHNTALQLAVLYGQLEPGAEPQCSVTGKVVGGLHVSARREQYEQLLDTIHYLSASEEPAPAPEEPRPPAPQCPQDMEPAVPTLRLDPALRAAVLAVAPPRPPRALPPFLPLTVQFELAQFTVELRADLGSGERSLVQLAFREFALCLLRERPHEAELTVSLHSVTMEDLTQPPESKHRMLMVSHAPRGPHKAVFVSASCPDLRAPPAPARRRSLPAPLPAPARESRRAKRDSKCGPTPPCSPALDAEAGAEEGAEAGAEAGADDGLVNVTVLMRDPHHPHFKDQFDSVSRLTRVQFNCLKLVVSIDSWVAVLDFFGVAGAEPPPVPPATHQTETNVAPDTPDEGTSQTEMSIRSLSVVLVSARGEVCGARAVRVRAAAAARAPRRTRRLHMQVGALMLADLTPRAPLWRDRLRTHGDQALEINYRRLSAEEALSAGHETELSVAMGPATYVHTKRFVHELHAFAHDFRQLRHVLVQARQKVSVSVGASPESRQRLAVRCAAPVIVLPVSGRARGALTAELAALRVDNVFCRAGDDGTVSTRADPAAEPREQLEVRTIVLEELSVWCARGGRGLRVRRAGAPLLPAPASLLLRLERNMSHTHNVPDMTIQGTLTTLQCALDPAQYRLVRGVLAHNLAADVADLPPHAPHAPHAPQDQVWTTSSLKLDLHDVSVTLQPERGAPLACINFIKSRLLLETYSDLGQDIDLVSQEILVSDTRYVSEPANRRGNVFTRIVQPMADHRHSVQAEVHARKRGDSSAYTILVNNMRLMAILDWWEAANQFIMQPPLAPCDPDQLHLEETPCAVSGGRGAGASPAGSMELKLNVTDSQLVLVEDASVWDTNAVILKSTTVITYRVADAAKPVSCELNELEVFSCVLGLEEETALAIVDPAALTVALHADRVLQISTGTLNLRLSYHDMRMFASMIQSLPAQVRAALSGKTDDEVLEADAPANSIHMRAGAGAGAGARLVATRWLPLRAPPPPPASAVWPLRALKVTAECVTLCVIDDCLDSDVPLLEVSLAELLVEQDLRKIEESFEDPVLVSTPCASAGAAGVAGAAGAGAGAGGGRLAAILSVDYYNRMLSGWEPAVEPWKFDTSWEYTLTSGLSLGRLAVAVRSDQVLGTNVTSSLVELAQLVRANWAADYYAPQTAADASPKGSPAGHRRRSPFVPYALRNHSGHKLWFTTLLTTCDVLSEPENLPLPDDTWVLVRAGDTEPFSFGARRGRGARAPGAAPLHQLALRLDGWAPPPPVCVDKVGTFFRTLTHTKTGAEARLVLEVSLEGSARKLVTVRSALTLLNRLPVPVDVRLEHAASGQWSHGSGRWTQVAAGALWAAPLWHAPGAVAARPVLRGARGPPPPAHVDWRGARQDHALAHCECRAPPLDVYRFCCVIVRTRFPGSMDGNIAGHALTLVPALRLENLLPVEVQYRAVGTSAAPLASGTLPPADTRPFHEVNVEEGVELSIKLEGFGWSSPVSVGGGGAGSFTARLKLKDSRARRLYLNARVSVKPTDGIKVSISAAYWLVNRTGLPLVFRAEGSSPAAGQFAEHELARMVAPLLFAFAEADGGPTVSARLGTSISPNQEWCSPFGLGPGTTVKKLTAGDRVFAVGVSVRAGRGRYRRTNIATLTPRFQLHNNTPYHLQFAQKCTATTLNDPGAMATHVSAVAGCYLPWHWARWERPQLLCVRVLANGQPRTAWSGGLRVDAPRAVHVACREVGGGGGYVFLRAEVVSQGATLFVVLTHADSAPPPLRVDNYSPVAIMFHQVGCGEECVVGAHASVQWALPEPEGAAALALRAPGGPRATLPLDALGAQHQLAYQNFIYVVFPASSSEDGSASDDSVLVLEVPLNSTRVILARKRYGDRAQLWRRGPNDQLIHEGSSPPQPTDALLTDEPTLSPHAMVLDIEGPAPRPGRAAPLVLRRADPRRASTQAWRLLAGRMACAHANLCVQPDGGLMALTPGSRVVLGLPEPSRGPALPPQQAVAWHTLRPGSGRLGVALSCAGPTRIVAIKDTQHPDSGWIEGGEEEEPPPVGEWEVGVALAGLSVSLVARAPAQELVHALLGGVTLRVAAAAGAAQLELAVQDMQWDNQLLGTPSPVLLHCLPGGAGLPALHAAAELMRPPARRYNALFFKHLVLAARPLAVRLEERLILKLWWWAAPNDDEAAREEPDEADYETRRMLDEVTALHARRYYCALLKVIPSQIRLSMVTASKLERELTALRRRLALTLIKFEDAAVELEPFTRTHVFEPAPYLARQMLKHFKDELKWQAAKILGSVDFLGNPLGFVADVSEGVSGLIYEGNVGALLKNVTHGLSNSAAKVTESLGDGLERVVGDEAHEETRRRIRSAATGAHLAAGLRGLGLGILGGMTSLVKHSYEGAAAEGFPGLLAGVGKGLVGTVTKPVIGVLDLAAETAAALRDSARRADRAPPARARPPRCAAGPGGLLPRYDPDQIQPQCAGPIGRAAAALRDSARRADRAPPARARPPRCAAGPGGLLPRYDPDQVDTAAVCWPGRPSGGGAAGLRAPGGPRAARPRAPAALRRRPGRPAAPIRPRPGPRSSAAIPAERRRLLGGVSGVPRGARHAARHPRAAVDAPPAHLHLQARRAAGRHGDAPQQPRVVRGGGGGRRALRGAGRARRAGRRRAAPARAVRRARHGRLARQACRLRSPAALRARAYPADHAALNYDS